MVEVVFALSRMIGLGTAAGLRPSLTIAVIGMMHHLHAGTTLNDDFAFLGHPLAIFLFVVLAIFECGVDKIPSFDRVAGRLSLPYRVVMGGIAGAATIPHGWSGIAVGALVGAVVAWFALYTKQLARPKTVPSDAALVLVSIWEDLAAFVGAIAMLLVSPLGFLALAFTSGMYWRTRHVHRAKYQRMGRKRPAGSATAAAGQEDDGQEEKRGPAAEAAWPDDSAPT
jgi:uncharacterized membrane protein